MAIMLSSPNRAVIKRWNDLLSGQQQPLEQTCSLGDLQRRCAGRKFDLILLHRPIADPAAFSQLRQLTPLSKFFLLSDTPNEEEGITFLKLGIAGYGNTYISSGRLAEAVRIISTGGVWLGQKVIQQLILESASAAGPQGAPGGNAALAELTRMEAKVAERVARGLSNLEIAAELDITERTVKAHLTSIYEKTKTGSRLSLALLINRR